MIESSKKYLIDSNIFIYHLNGELLATRFLQENKNHSFISRLTFIEVLSFDFTEIEKQNVINLLRQFSILDTTDNIAVKALENRNLKKIKLADNIIASTAQVNNLTLVTRNIKDFNNLEIKILNIFE
ncbi:MAG: type II toxin-antitoxin system VapC family toxin [Sulfurimonadaceae bacterium]